ncbi:MAG: dienelactone hydrolase family protein [Actinomycetota bacterium]|nr:dienelactone hydrolase family protein [Actinomycetota bacterium]
MDPADFDRFPFSAGGITHTVYKKGSGPVVIVLHELPGLSPTALDLGRRLAERFTVLMPLLFGSPGQNSGKRGFVQICLAREFTLLRTNRTSKVTGWLRALAREKNDGHRVAAIGMCATGGLVFGMLLEEEVVAAVASQPSMPFALKWFPEKSKRDLGLSPNDLRDVQTLDKPVIGLRFRDDAVCPRQRLESMERQLDAETIEIPSKGEYEDAVPPIPKRAHSVLTYHHVDVPNHPTHDAYVRVFAFLKEHLRPA